jgi:hypothetical protein
VNYAFGWYLRKSGSSMWKRFDKVIPQLVEL